ncbi:MAG: hypothetical protein LJF06_01210 [Gemmatimonadetes bacterium]|nr:hypothetical protein [Gemmatimonadota bacterium]
MYRKALKWTWLEHGTWAVLWTAFACGALVAWPPTPTTAATLVGLSAFAAAKVLVVRVHRGQLAPRVLAALVLAGGAALSPLLRAAPLAVIGVGAAGGPFLWIYFRGARSFRWTRSLLVELSGVLLMSSAAGLAVLSSRPHALATAGFASLLVAALFVPAIPRAKLLKSREAAMRWLLLGGALAGATIYGMAAVHGLLPWWGALAGLVFLDDARAGLRPEHGTTRRLGLALTLRNAGVVLLVALAWKPL